MRWRALLLTLLVVFVVASEAQKGAKPGTKRRKIRRKIVGSTTASGMATTEQIAENEEMTQSTQNVEDASLDERNPRG